jgi:2,4-dichlorophenol 6-monooxygenase
MLTQSITPTTNLGQDKFERLLFDHLDAPDKVLFSHAWVGSRGSPGAYVSSVESGGSVLEVRSRYIIGADGAGSPVRKSLGIEMLGPDNIQSFMNIHFRADLRRHLEDRQALLYWVMDEAVEGTFIAHNIDAEWIFMKTIPADEPVDSIDEVRFEQLLMDAIGADVAIEIKSIGSWRMTAQIAERYQAGGVFLVGDAAHRFPPTGGIGMNTGFQDAHNLIWKIAMVERGLDAALLDSYETERKPVAEINSAQSLGNATKMREVALQLDADGDGRVTSSDLDAVLADPGRQAAVQAAVDAQAAHFNMSGLDLGFCYQSRAILADGPPPASEDPVSCYIPSTTPGARLPHALLHREGRKISTLDLVPYDAMLVLVPPGVELEGLAASSEGDGLPVRIVEVGKGADIVPADEQFADLFSDAEILIVRPDGHIGARLSSAATAAEVHRRIAALLR